jgi:hypothetical protein
MTHLLVALVFGALCVILYKNKMLWPALGVGLVALIVAAMTGLDQSSSSNSSDDDDHHHHHHHHHDDC